ncbi:MAG TPA: FMN-binding negative transcriptional regulator [Puia sp.]|nr:FMN-binding negative transcriptional regulator [Puia sp.]
MYDISYFKASGQEEVMAFMRAHPFIILCGADNTGQPVATHVPVLLEQRGDKLFLLAHVMKKQGHTRAFQENPQVLAVFYGPHTYVSASWYEHQQVASTWNYQAVHVKGKLRFLEEDGLRNILTRLTETFENNPHSPSLVQRMDDAYVRKMMEAIIAFEIEVQSVDHVFKLSQNRDEKSYQNIIGQLREQGGDAGAVADEMTRRLDS